MPGDGLSNRLDGLRHDQIDAELSQFGIRSPRVPVDALARFKTVAANQTRVGRQHQRGIGEAGVGPDLVGAKALARQQPSKFRLARVVILLDSMGTDAGRGPLAIEAIGGGLLAPLIAAVITEKDNVFEAGGLEAAGLPGRSYAILYHDRGRPDTRRKCQISPRDHQAELGPDSLHCAARSRWRR